MNHQIWLKTFCVLLVTSTMASCTQIPNATPHSLLKPADIDRAFYNEFKQKYPDAPLKDLPSDS